MVGGRVDLLNVADAERAEQRTVKGFLKLRSDLVSFLGGLFGRSRRGLLGGGLGLFSGNGFGRLDSGLGGVFALLGEEADGGVVEGGGLGGAHESSLSEGLEESARNHLYLLNYNL